METHIATASGRRWIRGLLVAVGLVVLLVLSAGVWVVYQHSYAFKEERVTITGSTQPLDGVLALPKDGEGPHGLVVFVHGDGVANATRDEFYKPIWDSFARAGYASLSWNKPGVDGSPGNWLDQSMHDRALEAEAAIDWARTRSDIDPRRIGLWGVSQAGWVIPDVTANSSDLQFAILVGTAINWERQGEYNLLAEARARNDSQSDIDAAQHRRNETLALLNGGAGYDKYLASGIDQNPMSPERWGFIGKNYKSDVSALLPRMQVPILLCLGEDDLNVDVTESERIYRQLVPPELLTVQVYPDASHNIVKPNLDVPNQDSLRSLLVSVFSPKSLYADGYLENLQTYVQEQPLAQLRP